MFRAFIFPAWVRFATPSKRPLRRTSDRGRLIRTGAVVCAALGIDTDLTLIYQLFALLVSLIIIARIATRIQRPKVSIKRRLPRYATSGMPFQYYVDITNLGDQVELDLKLADNPKSRIPSLEEFLAEREPGEETRNAWDRFIGYHRFMWMLRLHTGISVPQVAIPEIAKRARISVKVEANPLRRGIVNFRSTTLLHPDPFGMYYGSTEFENPEHLTVLPRRYRISTRFEVPGGRHFQPGGVSSAWSVGESHEFVSLREYRAGDSMRKIHWPSTARRNKPVVKEYHEEYLVRQALVLDTQTEHSPSLEAAISVAASFVQRGTSDETMLDLIYVSNQPEIVSSGRGQSSVNHQLETLACLSRSEMPLDLLREALQRHAGSLSGFILILCGWSDDRAQLVETLQRSSLPFTVLVLTDSPQSLDLPSQIQKIDMNNLSQALLRL